MARILVTGSSGGLGLAAAQHLAADGHDVVVHARGADRLPGDPAGAQWSGTLVGDLSDLAQTTTVAEQANAFGRFDAVIHNAGTMQSTYAVTVNVLSPYLLTVLMDRPARLIYLSSSMHRGGTTDVAGLARRRGSYSDSKLWVTTLAMALAERWKGTGVHAVDPGWVPARMGGPSATDDLVAGHETQNWLATDPDVSPPSGGYWYHRRIQRPAPASVDAQFQRDVLVRLEDATGVPLQT